MPDMLDTNEPQKTADQKVDALSASVDKRFDDVDRRFDAVDEALVEQRKYTEFAFDKLATEMKAGFDKIDGRFNKVDGRLNKLEGGFNKLEGGFNKLEGGFNKLEGGFNRLERKLDQFIDTQAKTNELVERRLRALEPKHDLK